MVSKDICNVIASGSTGNCEIYFKTIAIDMGIPFSKIKPYLYDLQIVFLSHVHNDHFNIRTIKKLQSERPTLRFSCGEWMIKHLKDIKNIDVLELNKWYNYGEFKISIGKCYHDVPNCFFRLDKNGYKVFRVTDTGHLTGISAKNYDLYIIESNYDNDTIHEQIAYKESIGEYCYQKDSIETHLSEQQAREFIFENKGEKYEVIRLHESKS